MREKSIKNDTARLSREQLQLLACLKAYIAGEKAEVITDLCDEKALSALYALAYQHKLIPVVGETLIAGSSAAETEVGKNLLFNAKKQAVKQAYLADTFCAFCNELSALGFRPAVLKGELCRRLYAKGELRLSSDEDLFIFEKDSEGCVKAMLDMGFSAPSGAAPEWDASGVMTLNSESGLHIEVHKKLFAGSRIPECVCAHFDDIKGLDADKSGSAEISCFAPTDELLYLICHAAKHFQGSGFGPRAIADIAAFTMRRYNEIDFSALSGLLKQAGLYTFACAVYDICERYLGYDNTAFPLPMLGEGKDGTDMLLDCISGGIYGTATLARAQSAKYTIGAAGGDSNAKTTAKALFPPADKLAEEYPFLKKCRLLLPVAWGKRIIKYLSSGRNDGQAGARIGRERTALLKQYGLFDEK